MYKYLLDKNKNQFYPLIDDKAIVNVNTINDVQLDEIFNPMVEDILVEDEYRFSVAQYPSASIGVECIPERAGRQAYLDVTTSNPDCCRVSYIDGNTIVLSTNRRGESTITITETNSGLSKEVRVFIQSIPRLYASGLGPLYISSSILQESFDEAVYRVEAHSQSSSYQFSHWSDGSTENPREITIYEDTELKPYYKPILCKAEVRSSNNDWGTVQGGGSVRYGSQITIKAIPNSGYRFVSWSDGSTENMRQCTVTSDIALTAVFEIKMFTVNLTATRGGTVTGGGAYPYGSEVTVEAIPEERYEFYSWSDGDINPIKQFTLTEDIELTAEFKGPVYIGSSDNLKGTVIGQGEHDKGTEITIEALPNEGYEFYSWSDGNIENPRTLTVTQETTALFSDISGKTLYYTTTDNNIITFPNNNYTFFTNKNGNRITPLRHYYN